MTKDGDEEADNLNSGSENMKYKNKGSDDMEEEKSELSDILIEAPPPSPLAELMQIKTAPVPIVNLWGYS